MGTVIFLTLLLVAFGFTYWHCPVRPWVKTLTRRRHPFVTDGGRIEALEDEAWDFANAPVRETIARLDRELEALRPPCTDESHEHLEVMSFESEQPVRRICQTPVDLREALAAKVDEVRDIVEGFEGGGYSGTFDITPEQHQAYLAAIAEAEAIKEEITRQDNLHAFITEAYDRTLDIRLPYQPPTVWTGARWAMEGAS